MKFAKPIMVQGTMSSAGKSLITTGLCRIFQQDGYSVAPFKSQNMALNSFITSEGLEMGRAQVLQAQASGLEPSVDMNPILLKPTSEMGSQLIVNGEVRGQFNAAEYYKMKKCLVPEILAAYNRLSEKNDVIVIEGAGSPAEINLKDQDFVNMGLADLVDAPVILVGDIDRGGVFASLYGTLALLTEAERERVKGLIINKFRGDADILKPGLRQLEDLTGKPVIGVVPMLQLNLDDEDGESERLNHRQAAGTDQLDIAVIRLPRISNFTDFNVFEWIPDLNLRYVQQAKDLGQPDLVILPGTKNTMADLDWLKDSGVAAAIGCLADAGTPIAGICGGYQMLGMELLDPDCVEQGGQQAGLGLLPGRTIFHRHKTRTRIKGRLLCSGFINAEHQSLEMKDLAVSGYEIHMGETENLDPKRARPLIRLSDGRADGMLSKEGKVWGSYLHGLFDNTDFLGCLLNDLWRRKDPAHHFDQIACAALDTATLRENEINKLADAIRASLDMDAIYALITENHHDQSSHIEEEIL